MLRWGGTSDHAAAGAQLKRSSRSHYGSGMARVLLTGMSGAGKSTVLDAVARRGYTTVDTDYDGWELPGALWDEPRMSALLSQHDTIAIAGTAQNQGRFYDRFEHVIYLRVPLQVLLDRVRTRTNNPYGKTADQRTDITKYVAQVEPLIRRTATLDLDGLLPVPDLAAHIEQCLRS
ncbi:AAA family ATPase [Terrabacter lapilli]|uniref:AAA family ATPase n=2 Tax=Terrabacter lapilli TaxID=436231 RepID=A0ABN2RMF2_9MICO